MPSPTNVIIEDEKGKFTQFEVFVQSPTDNTANELEAVKQMTDVMLPIVKGRISRVTLTLGSAINSRSIPLEGADVEEKARFHFKTPTKHFTYDIGTINSDIMAPDRVDLSHPDVIAFVNTILAGITVNGELIRFTDIQGELPLILAHTSKIFAPRRGLFRR